MALQQSCRNLFYGYLTVILLLLVLPLNTSKELNNITVLQLRGDYFFHILLFLPWAFFLNGTPFKALFWLLFGLLFAMASEALQYLLPWRTYNVNDLLANMLGILAGFAVSMIINVFFRRQTA